jgi:uncharacterized membrane protein
VPRPPLRCGLSAYNADNPQRKRVSPGARARRALLADSLAAIVIAVAVLSLAAGLGVVGFFGLPLLLLGLLWIGAERGVARLSSRRRRAVR